MKKPSPRGHKALAEAILHDSTALQILLAEYPRRMVQRHANGDRPSNRYAYAYEVAFGIPLSAWQTKAELKALGKTQRDVDEDFDILRYRRAAVAAALSGPAQGIPTKPTKPPTLHDGCIRCNGTGWIHGVVGNACDMPRKADEVHPLGALRTAHVKQPDGSMVLKTGVVVHVNRDARNLLIKNDDGTESRMPFHVSELKEPS